MWIRGSELGSENVWYERVVISFVGSILIKRCTKPFGYFISGYFITARKQRLGQGNVFTPICQSFCSRGSLSGQTPPADIPPSGQPLDRHLPTLGRHPLPEMATEVGGTHPTGMHSCYYRTLLMCPNLGFIVDTILPPTVSRWSFGWQNVIMLLK